MTLTARDEANNEGNSAPHEFRLPQRVFVKPLARAIVEQRRDLALDANARDQVLIALDAFAIAPEKFTPELGTYLGLRSLYWSLAQAKSDDELRDVVAQMWAFANLLEEGVVSDAAARLRNAEEALRQALERGASDEELKRLMDELRAAMNQFMQALAEELRKNPQLARPLDPNNRQLRSQDLQSMLDRLENLARNGAKDAARQLLDQLQSMMENLQMARPGQMGNDADDETMAMLDELGEMIRKQQQLRDKTFREGQNQQRGQRNQRGQRGQQGQARGATGPAGVSRWTIPMRSANCGRTVKAARTRREAPGRDEEARSRPEPEGATVSKDSKDSRASKDSKAGRARRATATISPMPKAPWARPKARSAKAIRIAPCRARAARSTPCAKAPRRSQLQRKLQQQMGQGQPGQGRPGRLGPGQRAQQDTDPLGRPLRGRDYGDDTTVKVPGEIDAQRARRILEELRRRFGEAFRPQLELDYIERLLKDY